MIDGAVQGVTPLKYQFGFGKTYTIELNIENYETLKRSLTVDETLADQSYRLQSKFSNTTITVKGYRFEMVAVQGGSFTMGCTAEKGSDCGDNEMPAHQVSLDNYYMGKYEVTQGLWKAVMGNNRSYFKSGDNYPVENVSWDDCQEFISKLNSLTGKNFRLPTEAEWEYAARGGQGFKYSGSNNLDEVAWYIDNSGSKTHAVGLKKPNAMGLYDMNGNVWEWCSDWYGNYSGDAVSNPLGANSGSYRVLRGGSWLGNGFNCRVSNRFNNSPSFRYIYLGLRLCLP